MMDIAFRKESLDSILVPIMIRVLIVNFVICVVFVAVFVVVKKEKIPKYSQERSKMLWINNTRNGNVKIRFCTAMIK